MPSIIEKWNCMREFPVQIHILLFLCDTSKLMRIPINRLNLPGENLSKHKH